MHRVIDSDQPRRATGQLVALARQLLVAEGDSAAELPLGQLRACAILCAGPRPVSELSHELGVSTSAATQIADRLQRAGLVRRVTGPPDRRVRRLQLTERGAQIMRRREEARIDRLTAAWGFLSDRQRRAVLSALGALLRASAAAQQQPAPAEGQASDSARPAADYPSPNGSKARRAAAKSVL